MHFWVRGRVHRAIFLLSVVVMAVLAAACNRVLGKEYEYEEDATLAIDGSAIVNINASIASLVALRGMDLDPNPRARFDAGYVANVRRQAEAAGCNVERVSSTSWYRHGRRFIQIRLNVPNVGDAAKCGLLGWSKYSYADSGTAISLRQEVGAAAGKDVPSANWNGGELVAFKLHLPSKITFHNMRDMETGATVAPLRGNILAWEQNLSDRRAGKPVVMEMQMERESILRRTLLLFGAAFAAAILVMGAAIWWTLKRPRRRA